MTSIRIFLCDASSSKWRSKKSQKELVYAVGKANLQIDFNDVYFCGFNDIFLAWNDFFNSFGGKFWGLTFFRKLNLFKIFLN